MGLVLGGRRMPASWTWLSWAVGLVFLATVVLSVTGLGGDAGLWLQALGTGILVPVWAVWLAVRLRGPDSDEAPPG